MIESQATTVASTRPGSVASAHPRPRCFMSDVFRQQIVRYTLNGRRCKPDTPSAVRTVTSSKKWYGTVNGKRVPLSADKRVAGQMLRKLLGDAELQAVGLIDPLAGHKAKPLAGHLTDYSAFLAGKASKPKHVAQTGRLITAVLSGCGFVHPADLDVAAVSAFLTARRADGEPIAVPPGAEFTPRQMAAVLGVTAQAVSVALSRHGLIGTGTGQGKARRYPRSAVETLARQAVRGWSPTTCNHYVAALRSFTRWLVRTGRMAADPLATLGRVNAQTDIRRGRRELSADELQRLLAATGASGRPFRGLDGEARHALYATAGGTGFRVNALANLTPADFDLSPDGPTVTLPARFNKSKRRKVQPLPGPLAAMLRGFLAGKPADAPVWGGTWATGERAAMMLRADLKAAGIPYSVSGPDGSLYADFHALRHTYLTTLGRSGADAFTVQKLAGHASVTTTQRYVHKDTADLAAAVARLPNLTGAGSGYTRVTRLGDAAGHRPAPAGTSAPILNQSGETKNPRETQGFDANRHPQTPTDPSSPGRIRTYDPPVNSRLLYR